MIIIGSSIKAKRKYDTSKKKVKADKKKLIKNRSSVLNRNKNNGPNIANNRIIVYIPFNNLNVRETLPSKIYNSTLPKENTHLTEEWINKRINIFMNYTLKSLLNQTNQNYIAFIVYNDISHKLIQNELLKYAPLPSNIGFVSNSKYEKEVKNYLTGYKYFYELHLYSDDMYRRDYIDYLYNYKPKNQTEVLICQNGYIYNSESNELAKYFNFSSSFNCLIYNVKEYINGKRHNLFQPSETGIWTGAIRLQHEIIKEPVYINHSHSNNSAFFFEEEAKRNWVNDVWTDNKGYYNLVGEQISDIEEKRKILEDFLGAY